VATATQIQLSLPTRSRLTGALSAVVLGLLLAGASRASAGDYKGTPTCDYCAMFISEKAFGARLTKTDGKTLVFDANECMAAFTWSKIAAKEIRELRTINYTKPDEHLDVEKAWFLQSDKRPSPMGLNVSAYSSQQEAESTQESLGGEVLSWDGVVKLVRKRWFREKVD
jgi:copper chaperone NosL